MRGSSWQRIATSSPVAVAFLVLANAIPLLGVLLLGWDLMTIIRLYWVENGIVGCYAVLRILTAEGTGGIAPATVGAARGLVALPGRLGRVLLVPFFVFHYGMFWVGHGFFVWVALPEFLGPGAADEPGLASGFEPALPTGPAIEAIVLAAIALFLSHGASFLFNWIGRGEYRTASPAEEMRAPYGRVVLLHLTIIFGAIAVASLGAPVWALVVMVALKTAMDLAAHVRDRERAARRAAVPGPSPERTPAG